MVVLGIDPGINGGLAVVENECLKYVGPMPLNKERAFDVVRFREIILEHNPDVVFIEKAQSMPKQGVVSMFNYGKGYGFLLGFLSGLMCEVKTVTPKTWQGYFYKRVPVSGKNPKERALCMANKLYTGFTWLKSGRSKKPHDGMVDAALIATYGSLISQGRVVYAN